MTTWRPSQSQSFVSYLNSPIRVSPRVMNICVWSNLCKLHGHYNFNIASRTILTIKPWLKWCKQNWLVDRDFSYFVFHLWLSSFQSSVHFSSVCFKAHIWSCNLGLSESFYIFWSFRPIEVDPRLIFASGIKLCYYDLC